MIPLGRPDRNLSYATQPTTTRNWVEPPRFNLNRPGAVQYAGTVVSVTEGLARQRVIRARWSRSVSRSRTCWGNSVSSLDIRA